MGVRRNGVEWTVYLTDLKYKMLSRNFNNNSDQKAGPRGDTELNKEQGVLETTRRTT